MIEVVELTDAVCASAGALVAARHARERRLFPLLPSAYEDPQRTTDVVRRMLEFADGVAAIDRGEVIGFLVSFDSAPDPTSSIARYSPERAAVHLAQGHAVAEQVDAARVYSAMFEVLAARALDRGVVDHVVHVPIGERATERAWFALGFGRISLVAVRDLRPVDRAPGADSVTVRIATPDDLDVVDRLVDQESVFHAGSPIFRPYRRDETMAAVRAELADALATDDHAFVIGRVDGVDVGIVSVGPGLGSPLYVPDGAAYIAATAVLPDARGRGVGAALADGAFRWARDHGHSAASLHFATANATSTSFWTGLGFTPVMAHLRRRLDDRILTSRPPR